MRKRTWKTLEAGTKLENTINKVREYLHEKYDMPYFEVSVYLKNSCRTYGTCYHQRGKGYNDITVVFHPGLENDELDYATDIAPVVAHEFAHAIQFYRDGASDHGYRFRLYAREIAKAIHCREDLAAGRFNNQPQLINMIHSGRKAYGVKAIGYDYTIRRVFYNKAGATRYARGHYYRTPEGNIANFEVIELKMS